LLTKTKQAFSKSILDSLKEIGVFRGDNGYDINLIVLSIINIDLLGSQRGEIPVEGADLHLLTQRNGYQMKFM
jgi:hypothetical protein